MCIYMYMLEQVQTETKHKTAISISQTKMHSTKRTRPASSNSYQILSLSSSSADMIASNDDILTLILLFLRLKSLLKFKIVSKHWLSLVTHPRFSPKHNSRTISGLFVHRLSGKTKAEYDFINLSSNPSRAPFRSLTFVDDPSGIRILQSCNGLMLCCSIRADHPETNYYIYNPTTKQYTVLPGLGPGPRGRSSRNIFGIEIYVPTTGPWRPSGCTFIAPSNVQFKNGVFWNSAIHWLSDWGDSLYFDVEEEQIRDMPMPSVDEDVLVHRYFGESGGHLYLVEVYGSDNLQFDVYEMKRDYSGWLVKYKVDLNPIAAAFPEMARGYVDPIGLHSYAFSILCIVHEETDEDTFLVLHLPNKAIRYNFKDSSFKKLYDFAPRRTRVGGYISLELQCFDAYQFIKSFASV
ncbi:F-box protein At5g07610-like isoform X2 [Durio zibethinus]|uniref:F-box protein At5g07610-like isoform X2 n=1 Tax=Durio zibethinus TaxID=66656 RepID=A0A6P5Y9F4_DURZI|nr:F-box protein At5g07610-like isoform X2 [Durio zibethinus]